MTYNENIQITVAIQVSQFQAHTVAQVLLLNGKGASPVVQPHLTAYLTTDAVGNKSIQIAVPIEISK